MRRSLSERTRGGPLHGVRVLELGSMYAAPTACRMLRDFGADVIKVEEPNGGDYARNWQPQKAGLSLGFVRLNAGSAQSRSTCARLVGRRWSGSSRRTWTSLSSRSAQDDWRSGDLPTPSLAPDTRALAAHPRQRVRQSGPYSARPGFGTVAEAMSGYAFVNGWPDTPPTSPPFGFADSIAGVSAAYGTAMALFRRERSGRGDVVDVALYEPLMFMLGDIVLRWTANQEIQQREGNTSGAASPRGIYQARDGHSLSIAASAQRIAERLFVAMGRPELLEDPRYASNDARMANNDDLQKIVIGWVGSMSRSQVLDILERHDVVAAPVSDARDITEDPHFRERTLVDFENEVLGAVKMPGPILHFGSYPGPVYRRCRRLASTPPGC